MTARRALVCLPVLLALAAACNSPSPVAPTAPAAAKLAGPALTGNCTIGFDGLFPHGATFTGYADCGLKVAAGLATWQIWTGYGAPAPTVVFSTPAGTTTDGEITVSSSDGPFTFTSADLYSSTTKIPWTFTGELGGVTVFTASATQPNTFGAFATVANPYPSASIDVLRIRLTNPAAPCCANPMGLDNIRVVR